METYSVGNSLVLRLFGRSHDESVGCVLEGLPIGMAIDFDAVSRAMELRKPKDGIGTPRKEPDEVIFESGLEDGRVAGPVTIRIMNRNRRSSSYDGLNVTPRPGHADLPALFKFKDYDVSGGGQFSARLTAPLVAAGAVAQQHLASKGVRVAAYTRRIGSVADDADRGFEEIEGSKAFRTRAADQSLDEAMYEEITAASADGDSVGGIVGCMVTGLPIGFGGIWFDALDVTVARMMFSIPAVKGVEFGKGFGIASMRGSESNDQYCVRDGRISALSNNMGGVCGGMSDGMPLTFNVAFKPTPSISKRQRTVNLERMCDDYVEVKGRHDPCVVPRAVSVVEAMAALAVMDQDLSFQSDQ